MTSSRRRFLQAVGSSTLVSLAPVVPQFLAEAAARDSVSQRERVLVVIQLTGGNDGLNTIVPYGDDIYYQNRFTLAIGPGQISKIDDYVGFPPAMRGFARLLDDGQLAIVQGVGYPQPNRSHFESMDLWHTAHRRTSQPQLGWLGRYLDASHRQAVGNVPAIHLGAQQQPLALAAEHIRTPSIQSLEKFHLESGGDHQWEKTVQAIARIPRNSANDLLQFVQQSTSSAISVSRRIEQAADGGPSPADYPNSRLARQLSAVAQLIDAGLDTRIYYLALGGFDTHSNQAATHTGLLRQLGDATSAFFDDLSKRSQLERVLVMMFSEFGRRVKENASRGTDHGAAAPMLLAGGKVQPGLRGEHPDLGNLHDGDLVFRTDYRRVYATVLEGWLGCPSEPILGQRFDPLPGIVSPVA